MTTCTVTYARRGTLALQADVFRPAGDRPHAVVIWLHGGALIFGDRGMLPVEQRDRYLRSGFAVVPIDYRLAPETQLGGILDDLDAAHAWLHRDGASLGLDPRRLVLVGHSAGGYLALMAGTRFQPRPRALVSYYGYGDVAGEWYSRPDPTYLSYESVSAEAAEGAVGREPLVRGDVSRRLDYYRYVRQRGLWPKLVTGHDPDGEPSAFDPFCPIRNVSADYPPTFLVHGACDEDVPHARSVEMAGALDVQGVRNELIVLPGRGHMFDLDGEGLADPEVSGAFDRAIEFLQVSIRR